MQFVEENKRDFGIRACKPVRVSGAFHTPLMEPARQILSEALKATPISDPKIPVHSCYEEKVYKSADSVRKYLPQQVVRPVKWEQAMHRMFRYKEEDFMPRVYECGPGRALSGILNKVNGKAGRRIRAVAV